jgi:AcrR family transcriptional regulator
VTRCSLDGGVVALTPERIAEEVYVSPRTSRNYFSSKEEAIVAGPQDRAHEVADNLRRRPADEPIWESLLAEHLTSFEELSRRMAEVIAERTGTDVTRDVHPRLLADASGIALKTSVSLRATGTTGRTLAAIFGEALDLLSRTAAARSCTSGRWRTARRPWCNRWARRPWWWRCRSGRRSPGGGCAAGSGAARW